MDFLLLHGQLLPECQQAFLGRHHHVTRGNLIARREGAAQQGNHDSRKCQLQRQIAQVETPGAAFIRRKQNYVHM